ncbi:PAS domain-containing protein, partial [Brucella intermedia]
MSRQTDNAYPKPLVMPKRNRSGALRLLIVGILLTVAAIAYFVFRDQLGDGFALVLMGILSMVGVFYLFGAATGLIQFSQKNGEQDLAHSFMDSQPEGTVISDARGQIVYANQAYAMMTGVANAEGVRSLDNVLTAEPAASDAIYRLTNAVRDGLSAQEEVRLSGGLSREGRGSLAPVWYRIKARPIEAGQEFKSPLVAWQIADISDERAEQERFFQELQEAINHLDHAPAGFFSADPSGRIIYLNATLAEWLGVDLTQFTPGSLTLNDIVAGSGMALIKAVKAEPGTSRNTVIDLDLSKRNGQSLAVRFYHRVQAARDGTRGTSRTIVLDRAEG